MTAVPVSAAFADDDQPQDGYTVEFLFVRDLRIDPSYQRNLRDAHVRNIVANFDPYLLDPLVVSRRADGSTWVMDGQHRTAALREMGYDDQRVPCMVFRNLTLAQESRRFNTQDVRKPLNALERFRARLIEGQSAEMAVSEAVAASGFQIDYRLASMPGRVYCVAALLQLYRAAGPAHVRDVMATIASGFGTGIVPDAAMVGGVSAFLRRYDGVADLALLIDAMRRVSPDQVAREARNIKSALKVTPRTAYAMELLTVYNHGRRKNRLPDFAAK